MGKRPGYVVYNTARAGQARTAYARQGSLLSWLTEELGEGRKVHQVLGKPAAGERLFNVLRSQSEWRTRASFLIQSEAVDILAANVAEQQRRVCGVQPHMPSKPSHVVPIL